MSERIYLLTLCLPLWTILLVFGMRYFAVAQQAKAKLVHDEALRRIAEQATTAQADTASTLSSIQTTLADVRSRLASVEKILKEVE